jgi:hypothetical protein
MSRTPTFDWFSQLKDGVTSVNSAEHSGLLFTSKMNENAARIKEHVHVNRYATVHYLADEVGISFGSCQNVLIQDLNIWWNAINSVPHLLIDK